MYVNESRRVPFLHFSALCDFFWKKKIFQKFQFFRKKIFCAFWALDMAPTLDVPVLFTICLTLIFSQELSVATAIKDLGIHIDNKLSWDTHVHNQTAACFKFQTFWSGIFHFDMRLPKFYNENKISFLSILLSGSCAWYARTRKLDRSEKNQRLCFSWIFGSNECSKVWTLFDFLPTCLQLIRNDLIRL